MTVVSPLIAVVLPNRSLAWRSAAVDFEVSVALTHAPAGLTNTYADPALLSSPDAPTTIVSPLIAGAPKPSLACRSEAVSLAVCVTFAHPPPGLTNTYADPAPP